MHNATSTTVTAMLRINMRRHLTGGFCATIFRLRSSTAERVNNVRWYSSKAVSDEEFADAVTAIGIQKETPVGMSQCKRFLSQFISEKRLMFDSWIFCNERLHSDWCKWWN